MPAFIVHGTADSVVPFAQHAKALESRIPNARLLTIEGGEHVAIFTHRDVVKKRGCRFPAGDNITNKKAGPRKIEACILFGLRHLCYFDWTTVCR